MFFYAKYFLVFLSISVLSICAMHNNNDKNIWAPFLPILPPFRPRYEFYSSHDSEFLVPKNNPEQEKKQLTNIKNLLEEGLDADYSLFKIGPGKKPILCAAVEYGDVELVKLLLERGVDVNTRNMYGNTALYISVSTGNNFLQEYLLEKGANPNPRGCLITPLSNAIINKDACAIKSLIRYGANVNNALATELIKKTNKFAGDINFNLKKEYYSHIKTVLLVLKQCKRILYNNSDLRFLILSYLPEYHSHLGLYKQLQKRKYALKPFAFYIVDGHTKIVQDILHIKNKDNKNILELFPSITELNKKLLADAVEFKQKYPNTSSIQQGNLAFEILERYAFESELLIPEDILSKEDKVQTSVFLHDNWRVCKN